MNELAATAHAIAEEEKRRLATPSVTFEQVRAVAAALEKHMQEAILYGLWLRPALAPRHHSLSDFIRPGRAGDLPAQSRLL